MSLLTDLRPFSRAMRLGYQTLTTIFANTFSLETLIAAEHDEDTGAHNTRKIAVASGTYRYDSATTKWILEGGVGPLPAIGNRSAAGKCQLVFSSSMGGTAADYDVQITAESNSEAVVANYESKAITGLTVCLRDVANTGKDVGFSIELKKIPV